ncbi:unnamed protein product [Ranitomeya imitator]|uniref:Helix-turn-helix domain-containing protein n=1 Tax=Ranitomeya imitator TaxID=111125 RepID=A0ABN9MJL2_9NEOB|nr:unnamed protein product [Ranitomeya imitator]
MKRTTMLANLWAVKEKPIASSLPSFIKDTADFIRVCRDITLTGQELLITCDVESLYSNISHAHGIKALSFFLDRLNGTNRLHDSFIVDLLNFVLHHNYFLFDRTYHKQVSGVAMGARCAPAYANIFLGWWEETLFFCSQMFRDHIKHWYRFIDDVFFIWVGSETSCLQFLRELNDNSLNIFLTHSCSPDSAVFLDLRISTEGNRLVTDLFRKPTATNSLLQYQSFHPQHTRMGIPTGQFLRVRRNCTTDESFRQQARDLSLRFQQRGYPRRVISKAFQRAQSSDQASLLVSRPRLQDSTVRFITEYSTNWNQVRHILTKNWDILTSDSQTVACVSPRPLMTAKRASNLRDILTRSHFSRPVMNLNRGIRLRGSFPCGDSTICPYMPPTKDLFHNPLDNTDHRLCQYINCKTSFVIYAIICPCHKVYIGQTSQELRKRAQKHLSTIHLAHADLKKVYLSAPVVLDMSGRPPNISKTAFLNTSRLFAVEYPPGAPSSLHNHGPLNFTIDIPNH